jgi:hypothetical protein
MSRSLARVAAWLVVLWPHKGIVGTYETWQLPTKGFTLAMEVRVGSMDDPEAENSAAIRRKSEIDLAVRPHRGLYETWFERVLNPDNPWADWLGALDAQREMAKPGDYKARVPAPAIPRDPMVVTPLDSSLGELQIYLHLAADKTGIDRARAAVGFMFAAVATVDPPLRWSRAEPASRAVERLKHAARYDAFEGQAVAIATVLKELRDVPLTAIETDVKMPAEVRALALVLQAGRDRRALTDVDLRRVAAARAEIDARTLVTWVLATQPKAREADLVAQLEVLFPGVITGSFADFLKRPGRDN